MKTRMTSRGARLGIPSRLRLAGTALALGVSACSSDSEAPSAPPSSTSTAPGAGDSNAAGNMPGSEAATEANVADMENGMPAASASEGQQVTDLAPPEAESGSGESSPSMPTPGEEATPPAPDPGATEPAGPAPAVPSAGCGQTRTLLDGNRTIASGGMNRTYYLETPDQYDNTFPHRVVFMFHWNYGSINAIVNPPDADRNTDRPFYGFGDLTDGKTIFVVPQGLVGAGGGAGWANVDNRDVNFTDDMLEAISSDLCIDTSRVFTTGFSFGAGMSIALACVRPDKFRAAAIYAAGFISGVQPAQCTTPIPIFHAHGVDDQILQYPRGLEVLNTFSNINGCTALTPPTPPNDGHTCTSLEGCSVPTRFCNFGAGQGNVINNLRGHYPVPKDPGQTTSWVPAEAWSFITQF
jgi:hypothetical protein